MCGFDSERLRNCSGRVWVYRGKCTAFYRLCHHGAETELASSRREETVSKYCTAYREGLSVGGFFFVKKAQSHPIRYPDSLYFMNKFPFREKKLLSARKNGCIISRNVCQGYCIFVYNLNLDRKQRYSDGKTSRYCFKRCALSDYP